MRQVAAFLAVTLMACSGSNSVGTGDGGGGGGSKDGSTSDTGSGAADSGGSHDSSSGGDTSTGHDSGGGGDTGVSDTGGGDAGCENACIAANMAGYKLFVGDELKSCGCGGSAPCKSMCTSECADPSTLTSTSPCGECLSTQEDMGEGSSCTVSSGISCLTNKTCSAFVKCEEACMKMM
jgi:hypothetical protein